VSQREIAQTLGISQAAVEKQAARALKLIVAALEVMTHWKITKEKVGERSRRTAREGR